MKKLLICILLITVCNKAYTQTASLLVYNSTGCLYHVMVWGQSAMLA